jgi:hypothetical protein
MHAILARTFARAALRTWEGEEKDLNFPAVLHRMSSVKYLQSDLFQINRMTIMAIEAAVATALILATSAPSDGQELRDMEENL